MASTVALPPDCLACGAFARFFYTASHARTTYPCCASWHCSMEVLTMVDEDRALATITRWIRRLRKPCEDCGSKPGVCTFLHLRGTLHKLCEDCFVSADHEDDYLVSPRTKLE